MALFTESYKYWLDKASEDGFKIIEILCEGPYTWPRNALAFDSWEFEIFDSYDIDVYLHSPTVDLNPASINPGVKSETLSQIKETIDLAAKIGAEAVTTHPGVVHRPKRLRDICMEYSIEIIRKCNRYAKEQDVRLSVENMPNRDTYLCNNPDEYQTFIKRCGCHATVDLGHANTTKDPSLFFKIKNILYYHINDNNGKVDEHLTLGEGTFNLKLLNRIDNIVIELDDYQNVLKSRDLLLSIIV